MQHGDDLRRTFDRVTGIEAFRPGDRIWWLYLREAVAQVLFHHHLAELRAAHDAVKAFPENLPNEAACWLRLRDAVAAELERQG